MNENQIKADAINEFVSLMIGAFESGFVDKNNPTLQEIHRVAQNHVKDSHGIELPNIDDQWGEETAKACGLGTINSDDRVKELEAMLLFLVKNDSINDSSIEKEVAALLNAK